MSRRHAVTILYALHDAPLHVDTEDGSQLSAAAVLIAPHVARSLDARAAGVLSFNLDQLSYEYHALMRMLGDRAMMAIDASHFRALRRELSAFCDGMLDCGMAYRLFNQFVRAIVEYRPPNLLVDMRVLHVANRVMMELPLTHTIEQLADNVGISADRLRHLFAEQLGVSLKSYMLWAKMRRAALLFPTRRSLTEIAHSVGFADSAHLTRTFKSYFGLTPSFLADPTRVEVRGC